MLKIECTDQENGEKRSKDLKITPLKVLVDWFLIATWLNHFL